MQNFSGPYHSKFSAHSSCCLRIATAIFAAFVLSAALTAQDGSTSLQGIIEDASGARIASAAITVSDPERGFRLEATADAQGMFNFGMLAPGRYDVTASAPGMTSKTTRGMELFVGGVAMVRMRLVPAAPTQTVTVNATAVPLDGETSDASADISNVVSQQQIQSLPLNGRRFTDLALLGSNVVQDPRGQTSNSNGDLSFGGVRGFNNNFQVDGSDDNNSFFAQARGGYRAPYQFSNEVIKEFRVSPNSYSAELGRAGGAVFNVATKSGTNEWHGSGFYYLRDRDFDAQQAYADSKPDDRQQQFGATLGGPIRKDRIFFYAGFDQDLLTVPSVMEFANGSTSVVPTAADYDYTDQTLVAAAAQHLNQMAGVYPTTMGGNAGYAKIDFNLSPKQLAFVRVSTSRLSGTNNVFFDPSSPVTGYAESANGSEDVKTESIAAALTSAWTNSLATNLRLQFSRDLQFMTSNSDEPWTKIYDVVAGFGGASTLPRDTREHKLNLAETVSYQTSRVQWKFGGDFTQAWVYNYYPYLFQGEYYFDNVKVNPFTYAPEKYGEPLTPLRAYAHDVPRYYMQDFGTSASHPNSRVYGAFLQSTIRVARNFTLNAGLRYDLQTFEPGALESNPQYAPSGKVPADLNNFSPRLGFAYSVGERHTMVIRGGAGLFYMPIPAIYASQVATDNGLQQSQLFLDLMNPAQAALFPKYPSSLVNCPPGTLGVQSAGLSRRTGDDTDLGFRSQLPDALQRKGEPGDSAPVRKKRGGYRQLRICSWRSPGSSLDVNLPAPTITEYPVYNEPGRCYGHV